MCYGYWLPYESQVQAFTYFLQYYITKNVGIHLLLIRHLRPTTALCTDEQSDTHATYYKCTRKCAMKAWLAFKHTTDIHIYVTVASYSAMSLVHNLLW